MTERPIEPNTEEGDRTYGLAKRSVNTTKNIKKNGKEER